MFNTLKFAKELEATGMTREQAETFTKNLSDMVFDSLATKDDLKKQSLLFKTEMNEFKNDMKEDIAKLDHKIDLAVHKLTIKLGSLMAIGLGVMSFIVKFSN
jgi:hypothetical protein